MLYEPSSLLFFRTDLFEQAGLDPSAPPTSWEELIAAAAAVKASVDDVVPFQTAQNLVDLSWSTWGLQMNAAGHLPISDDWSTSLADDPAYGVLLETYQRLMADGLLAPQALAGYGDITPLAQGQLAMQACGSWAISVLVTDYADLVPNLAVAPLPSFDGDLTKPTGTLGGWSLGVDARSEHPAEAAAVISWLLAEDPTVPGDYFAATSQTKFSPRASVADAIAADADTSVNPWYDVLVGSVIDHQILEPTYDWSVSEAFGTALEKAQQGQDIAAAQATAHSDITRAIEEKGLAGQNG